MGSADSALLQIVSFITSVRDAAEPRKEVTNFQPDLHDMAIFGKAPAKKWSNFIYIAITFQILVQNR